MSIFIIYYCNNIVVWGYLIKIKTTANKSPRRVGEGEGNRYNRLLVFFLSIYYYEVGANRFIEMTKNIIVSSSLTINGPPPPRTPIPSQPPPPQFYVRDDDDDDDDLCVAHKELLKPVCAFIYNNNNNTYTFVL